MVAYSTAIAYTISVVYEKMYFPNNHLGGGGGIKSTWVSE